MIYKATRFFFHEYTAVKSTEMHYQACKCRNQILSKFTIVTSEANGRSFQEMNPKSAWLSPRNLRQLLHDLNCPSQIGCYPRSDITITNYTQSISTTTREIFDDTTLISPLCSFIHSSQSDMDYVSTMINIELSKISDWLAVNKLSLNTAKTKFMLFHNYQTIINEDDIPHLTINDTIIERVT